MKGGQQHIKKQKTVTKVHQMSTKSLYFAVVSFSCSLACHCNKLQQSLCSKRMHFFFLFLLLVASCMLLCVCVLVGICKIFTLFRELESHLKFSLKTLDHYTDFQIFFSIQLNIIVFMCQVCVGVYGGICIYIYMYMYRHVCG